MADTSVEVKISDASIRRIVDGAVERLQHLRADAWDEGFTAGREDVFSGDHVNPYREQGPPPATADYWFAPDGDDEPTMWRTEQISPDRLDCQPVAVIRRCDNPEAFDLLHALLPGAATNT